jgi:hypothetical protein
VTRVRIWSSRQNERPITAAQTVHCGDGFLTASPGQIVVVAVIDTWLEASRVLEALDPNLTRTDLE